MAHRPAGEAFDAVPKPPWFTYLYARDNDAPFCWYTIGRPRDLRSTETSE